jgi:hypothetical protein
VDWVHDHEVGLRHRGEHAVVGHLAHLQLQLGLDLGVALDLFVFLLHLFDAHAQAAHQQLALQRHVDERKQRQHHQHQQQTARHQAAAFGQCGRQRQHQQGGVLHPVLPQVHRADHAQHQCQQAGLQRGGQLLQREQAPETAERVELVKAGLKRLHREVPPTRQQAGGQGGDDDDAEHRRQQPHHLGALLDQVLDHRARRGQPAGVEAQAGGEQPAGGVDQRAARQGQQRDAQAKGAEVAEVARARHLAFTARLVDLALCGR